MKTFLALIVPIDPNAHPEHPIVIPPIDIELPPGIERPPGYPAHPIILPGTPTHPIAPGGPPPGTWGGAGEPFPTPPIVIPPVDPPALPPDKRLILVYVPGEGWVWAVIDRPAAPGEQPPGYNPPSGGAAPQPVGAGDPERHE